jgi:hypothetical protein
MLIAPRLNPRLVHPRLHRLLKGILALFLSLASIMARLGQQDVPLVVGLFLLVLAMVSMGNLGFSIANSRDIYKMNAKINAMINQDSHEKVVFPITNLEPSDGAVVIAREEVNTRKRQLDQLQRH